MEQKNNSVRKRLPQIDLYEKMSTSTQALPTSPAMDNYLPPSSVVKIESESPKQRGSLQSLMRSYGAQTEVKHSAVDNYMAPSEMPTKEEDDDEDKEMLVGSPPSRFKQNDDALYTYSSPNDEEYNATYVYQVNDNINTATAAETMKNLYYPPEEYLTKSEPYSTIEADHDTSPASYALAEPQKGSYPSYDINNNNTKEPDTYDDVKPVTEKPKKEETKAVIPVEDRKTDAELLTFFEGYRNATPKSSKWAQLKNKLFTRNWNKEFQQLLDLDDSKEKFVKLRNLEHDFVYAAETYGRIIISEHCLPDHQKTINPVSVGGVAGGEKYIVSGILFKFAIDGFGLYGSDENAMKASTHELHGMQGYYQLNIKGIHVPLMAFIDYRGWRLQAVSVLPISGSSLVYGSADGGRTVLKENPQINSLMKEAGRLLNLKPHMVGPEHALKEIDSCCDIEGHMGTDGRFYLLDFARVAPPEPPTVKGANLYRLLRLEFVRNYPKSLSPDSYSNMGRHDYRLHCDEVDEAYRYLIQQVIPDFALKHKNRTDFTYFLRDMHQNGINCRHLGLVRTHFETGYPILAIALSRLCKCHLKSLMREVTRQTGSPSDEHYRHVTLSYLNTLIGTTSKSSEYWKVLEREVSVKFPQILKPEEQGNLFGLIKQEQLMFRVIKQVLQLTAIQISEDALEELQLRGDTFEFVQPDLITMDTKVSRLGIIDYADGMSLYYEAMERSTNKTSKLRLLTLSRKRIETAMATMSTDFQVRAMLGKIINEMAMCEDHPDDKKLLWKEAQIVLSQIIYNPMVDAGIRFNSVIILGKVISNMIKEIEKSTGHKENTLVDAAIIHFEKCTDLFSDRYETLARLGKILCLHYKVWGKQETMDKAVQVLEKCFELIEKQNKNDDKLFGNLYFTFAETLTQKMDYKSESYEQNKVKAGQSFQMAFKLNPNTIDKMINRFAKMNAYMTMQLFTYTRLIEYSPVLKEVLEKVTGNLEELSLVSIFVNWNSTTPEEYPYFSTLLSMLRSAKSLTIGEALRNMSTELCIQSISPMIMIQKLIVWNSPEFNDDCLAVLAKNCPHLSFLDVKKCDSITDKGVGELLELRGLGIKELRLGGCTQITDTTVENLAKYDLEIERLRLSGSKITDASLLILQKFPFLSHLSLQFVTTITADGLKQCCFDSVRTINLAHSLPIDVLAPIIPTVFPNMVISCAANAFFDYYNKSPNAIFLKLREQHGIQRQFWIDIDGQQFMSALHLNGTLSIKPINGNKILKEFEGEIDDSTSVHIRKVVTGANSLTSFEIVQGPRISTRPALVTANSHMPVPVKLPVEFLTKKYEFIGIGSIQGSSFEGKIIDVNKQGSEVAKTSSAMVPQTSGRISGQWTVQPGASITDVLLIHFILVMTFHLK